jgi:hypothetical protein
MNDRFDLLEAELEALRPRRTTPDLRRRVAEQLADVTVDRPLGMAAMPTVWSGAATLATALAAACFAAILLWQTGGDRILQSPENVRESNASIVTASDLRPTVMAYRRALADDPRTLESLLDQDATRSLPNDPQTRPVHAFAPFHENYAYLGEF